MLRGQQSEALPVNPAEHAPNLTESYTLTLTNLNLDTDPALALDPV